ncbi:MAG: hypothetical protein Fues2KO_42360 [Fuerstiella sp.]
MADIRFLHCDRLRLGSAVQGLINSPSWLRTLAENAFRQSTRNLVDLAIAQQVDFVLVAGSICDDPTDFAAAVRWLIDERSRLNRRQVRLIVAADNDEQAKQLRAAADEVLLPHQVLQVHAGTAVSVRASAQPDRPAALTICRDARHVANSALTYEAQSASASRQPQVSRLRDDHVASVAGPLQSVCSSDRTACGAQLVDVAVADQDIRTSPIHADVLRFADRTIDTRLCSGPEQIVEALVAAGEDVAESFAGTTVLDWSLRADLESSAVTRFSPASLLQDLQAKLHGGHRGVWARRIHFSAESTVMATSKDQLAQRFLSWNGHQPVARSGTVAAKRLDDVVLHGLSLLRKAA